MMKKPIAKVASLLLGMAGAGAVLLGLDLLAAHPSAPSADDAAARPYGIAKRVAWTTSRLTGSPEPPQPYRSERMFPKLPFRNPLLCARFPDGDRIVVGEQVGKMYTFPNDPQCARPDLFLDLTTELKTLDPKVHKGI